MYMKTPLSCCDLEVLIWCHTTPQVHPRITAVAVKESLKMFLACGMIKESEEGVYQTTDKGEAMIKALQGIPEPIAIWTIPEASREMTDLEV